jgi:hypothetical protein
MEEARARSREIEFPPTKSRRCQTSEKGDRAPSYKPWSCRLFPATMLAFGCVIVRCGGVSRRSRNLSTCTGPPLDELFAWEARGEGAPSVFCAELAEFVSLEHQKCSERSCRTRQKHSQVSFKSSWASAGAACRDRALLLRVRDRRPSNRSVPEWERAAVILAPMIDYPVPVPEPRS